MLCSVSLGADWPSTRRSDGEKPSSGGFADTTLKKENGARFSCSLIERGDPGNGTGSDGAKENAIEVAMGDLLGANVHAYSLDYVSQTSERNGTASAAPQKYLAAKRRKIEAHGVSRG